MKRIYFGINGQFGDIIIQEPSLRKFINENPETKIVLGCNKKYSDILELYKDYHPNIERFKIWDGYDNWPTKSDQEYIREQNFDYMFKSMPQHTTKNWVKTLHQVEESGLMQGIKVENTQISLPPPKDIIQHENAIAISLFPNYPHGGIKAFTYEDITNIVAITKKMGFKILHLNGPNEPDIPGAKKINGSFLESVRNLLGTRSLLCCDTAMSWISSAYKHPTIGFYSWGYNPIAGTSANWQPTNPNATYLEAHTVRDIPKQRIVKNIYENLKEYR